MYNHRKRTGYSFDIDDGESSITILRPLSQEISHDGTYLVLEEDAYGKAELKFLRKDQIAAEYAIDQRDLEDV